MAFVRSGWHSEIVDRAQDAFLAAVAGSASLEAHEVPGALELPLHVRTLAKSGWFDGIVAAGLIVDGGIYQHEFVATAVISGLMQVQLDADVPVFSCVLTPQSFNEDPAHQDFLRQHMSGKGEEVARACLTTLRARADLTSRLLEVPRTMLATIAVIDTTFARADMGTTVSDRIARTAAAAQVNVTRTTVPGFKDLAAAARRAIDNGADLVVACAMPGPEPIDESCAKDASFGLQMVQALTGVPILEVFVHMNEARLETGDIDEGLLHHICQRRCEGHADNAVWMTTQPTSMTERAGTGRRQGSDDVGTIQVA